MVNSYLKEDIEAINELGVLLNPKFETLFHIDKINPNEKIYVYKENNEILGFIHIGINYEVVDLLNIIVKKEARNKGIATLLIDYMITDLPESVQKILLEVDVNNKEAIKLYYKFNFEVINTRNNYYGNNKALIMERSLI